MRPGIAMLCSGRAASGTQTLLSATNKASSITLADSGVSAVGNIDGSGIALSANSKASGKFYFEVLLATNATSGNIGIAAGLKNGTTNLSTYLGNDNTAWGTWCEDSGGTSRSTYYNATASNKTTGHASPAIGDRCRIAVDISAGKLWLSKWGSTSWVGGGDPETGASPTYTLSAGTYYIALNPRGANRKLSLVDPMSWASAAPSGFQVWT